ncbi:hypothetical protein SEA_GODONK_200 [Gordonia phage GodonK]|uniref:Uncharacterized protein n=1 Tax=Gordonia phage GodonK TaxID=2562192 RepID=A0A4D6E2C3_9CAUD|nr:hypothetical protein HOV33_gp168 [Gordonia phage GodonK]QBZ72788.1 hypothetical protein SEA_GODONK_200 [Gordonia phage GodonK]
MTLEDWASIWWVFTVLGLLCTMASFSANGSEAATGISIVGVLLCLVGFGLAVAGAMV